MLPNPIWPILNKDLKELEAHMAPLNAHDLLNVWVALVVDQWKEGMLAALRHVEKRRHEPQMPSVWASMTQNASSLFSRSLNAHAWDLFDACLESMHGDPMHKQSVFLHQCFSSAKYSDQSVEHFSFLLHHPVLLERQIPRISLDFLVELSSFSQSPKTKERQLHRFMKESITPEEMLTALITVADALDLKWKNDPQSSDPLAEDTVALAQDKEALWWKEVSIHPLLETNAARLQRRFPDWHAMLEKNLLWVHVKSGEHLPSTERSAVGRKI